ncbi:hypothetical protein ACIP6T_19140 [Pantoea sp. NPDC088449]|uniref:hypothetical protein n=1 Tax=Pantoea sp. NPDC088449 TaxID=3364392 RepID=UPI003814DB50
MNKTIRFMVMLLALPLAGCAYSPKQVDASRPLVNKSDATHLQAMPENLQQSLNTLPQGAALSANGATFTLGQRYVSALGQDCVELLVNSNRNQSQRTACKNADRWYLIPQLEQASVRNLIAE